MHDHDKDAEKLYRLYVPSLTTVNAGGEVSLPDGEIHHALHVLRLKPGQRVALFDGMGRVALGVVARAGRNEVLARVDSVIGPLPRQAPQVELAFAVPKGNRLDWLLEKACELGAAGLMPVIFERSVAGSNELGENKLSRWQGHCIAAAKQSGLNYLPHICQPIELSRLIDDATDNKFCLLGDPSPQAVSMPKALARRGGRAVRLVVGPEGGLTPQETDACLAAGWQSVRVGATTLRVETAAIAMLAVAMACDE